MDKKQTRNPLGTIKKRELIIGGKKVVRFEASKRYTDASGRRKEKTKRCLTRSEAKVALINFNTELENIRSGKAEPGGRQHTFFELTDYFTKEHVKEAVFLNGRQIGGYRQNLANLLTPIEAYKDFFGDTELTSITYEHLRRFREHLAKPKPGKRKPPSTATVNRKLAYLRRLLNVAVQLRWLDKNPFKDGKPLIVASAEASRERVLTFEEEERLLAACDKGDSYQYVRRGKVIKVSLSSNRRPHLRLAIIMAIESGMRKKEIFTTKFSQIDLNKGVILLNAGQTKALKRRLIPISARLEKELRSLFAKTNFGPNDLIFGGMKDCDRAFRTACRLAGIEDLRFHDLRHTANTWMDEAGITGAARLNIIGHEDVRTNQIYSNMSQDVIDSTRVKMDEFRKKLEERKRLAEIGTRAAASS